MPYYIYNDDIVKNSVVFIDEFDTTKNTLLGQIIDDAFKVDIDIFSLFLNIYYSLNHLIFPKSLLVLSEYRQRRIETGEWSNIDKLLEELSKKFNDTYTECKMQVMMKSFDFKDNKAFIFDDGKSLNVFKDNTKKTLKASLEKDEKYLKLIAANDYTLFQDEKHLSDMLRQINYAIGDFVKKVAFISKNYTDLKNEKLKGYNTKYTFEESILTILSAFNIAQEFKQYLLDKVIDKDANLKLDLQNADDDFMRKGFEFTEVEDDHNHDLQTKSHAFKFATTPENIILKLAIKARVLGISATASIKTVIGNYDLDYINKILKDDYYYIDKLDIERLSNEFIKTQEIYKLSNIKININLVDDLPLFSHKEKSQYLINMIFKQNKEKANYYLTKLDEYKSDYHFFIISKLAYMYDFIGKTDCLHSFLCFLNSSPKKKSQFTTNNFINIEVLEEILNDVSKINNYDKNKFYVTKSDDFDEKMSNINLDLKNGLKVMVISTYGTIGSGKNIQYPIPECISKDNYIRANGDIRADKDYDGIYLETPTNLIQNISFDSDDKVKQLANYLFQQEYLYQNKCITYNQKTYNILSGFRRTYYGDQSVSSYKRNPDILLNTAQIIIQAVGRICRCRNKNKNIFIFTDREVAERLSLEKEELEHRILNNEFRALLNYNLKGSNIDYRSYTSINKSSFTDISKQSKEVRDCPANVQEWQELREYVLKNPTTDNPLYKYKKYYFNFEEKHSGYAFKLDKNFNIIELKFNNTYESSQVSAEDCDLIAFMNIKELKDYFLLKGYATEFKKAHYIMSQSLYKQIYKAALGEVIGKYICEKALGVDLEELDDYTKYESFDFKSGNIYFDFKHWNEFIKDNDTYVKKIQWKLNTVKGKKVAVINIMQRGNHILKENVNSTVIQVPYLINSETCDIDYKHLDKLNELI